MSVPDYKKILEQQKKMMEFMRTGDPTVFLSEAERENLRRQREWLEKMREYRMKMRRMREELLRQGQPLPDDLYITPDMEARGYKKEYEKHEEELKKKQEDEQAYRPPDYQVEVQTPSRPPDYQVEVKRKTQVPGYVGRGAKRQVHIEIPKQPKDIYSALSGALGTITSNLAIRWEAVKDLAKPMEEFLQGFEARADQLATRFLEEGNVAAYAGLKFLKGVEEGVTFPLRPQQWEETAKWFGGLILDEKTRQETLAYFADPLNWPEAAGMLVGGYASGKLIGEAIKAIDPYAEVTKLKKVEVAEADLVGYNLKGVFESKKVPKELAKLMEEELAGKQYKGIVGIEKTKVGFGAEGEPRAVKILLDTEAMEDLLKKGKAQTLGLKYEVLEQRVFEEPPSRIVSELVETFPEETFEMKWKGLENYAKSGIETMPESKIYIDVKGVLSEKTTKAFKSGFEEGVGGGGKLFKSIEQTLVEPILDIKYGKALPIEKFTALPSLGKAAKEAKSPGSGGKQPKPTATASLETDVIETTVVQPGIVTKPLQYSKDLILGLKPGKVGVGFKGMQLGVLDDKLLSLELDLGIEIPRPRQKTKEQGYRERPEPPITPEPIDEDIDIVEPPIISGDKDTIDTTEVLYPKLRFKLPKKGEKAVQSPIDIRLDRRIVAAIMPKIQLSFKGTVAKAKTTTKQQTLLADVLGGRPTPRKRRARKIRPKRSNIKRRGRRRRGRYEEYFNPFNL